MACLAKDPADRPSTATELERRLAESIDAGGWTERDETEWWSTYSPAGAVLPPEPAFDSSGLAHVTRHEAQQAALIA